MHNSPELSSSQSTLLEKVKRHGKNLKTPFLTIDLNAISLKYKELSASFSEAKIFYAIKANPEPLIISLLANLGAYFDIATPYELDIVLNQKISPDRISYGNTIKKSSDIAYAHKKGVNIFACDSLDDLLKIAHNAPGTNVFFRLTTNGQGADWPLSKKFGAHSAMIHQLLKQSRKLDVHPLGISFHVGSQQRDIGQWDDAIAKSKSLFDLAEKEEIELSMLNLGGGLPCNYLTPTRPMETYISEIKNYLKEHFENNLPEIFLEPGRALTGESGILTTEVILKSIKSSTDISPWIYIDAGLYNGLAECLNEAIKYPIVSERHGEKEKVILAGPTCDSTDILYKDFKYELPKNIKEGDRLYILSTGAYTASYASVNFNGFPPLKSYFI